MKSFTEKVLSIVRKIPRGKTLSYGEVAKRAGSVGGSRAVGTILAKNTDKNIPCHRVVRSNGTLGAYNGLRGKTKEELLREEGALKK
jgi:O-6-methylguanine DNA methyltransferase